MLHHLDDKIEPFVLAASNDAHYSRNTVKAFSNDQLLDECAGLSVPCVAELAARFTAQQDKIADLLEELNGAEAETSSAESDLEAAEEALRQYKKLAADNEVLIAGLTKVVKELSQEAA